MLYQAELLPVYKKNKNAASRSRTYNRLIRSQVLYPIELWLQKKCRESGSNRYGDHSPQDFKSCASANSATPALQYNINISIDYKLLMKRKTGFEPATPTLARWCSPTELLPQICRLKELNPRPSDYKSDALPTELSRQKVRVKGLEPPRLAALDPKSSASANSATPALSTLINYNRYESCRIRTCDPLIKSQMLYQLS